MGRISKHISQNMNTILSGKLKLNQWKSAESIINWFRNIPYKHLYKFLTFDNKDFYP